MASRLVKPLGEYIVTAGDEEAFLSPLPIWLIPGIEGPDLARLRDLNLTRVHQVTGLALPHLRTILGARAEFTLNALRGVDVLPVTAPGGTGSHRSSLTTASAPTPIRPKTVENRLYALVEQAGRQLREQQRAARRIAIVLSYSDGRRCTRQVRVEPATANDLALFPFARRALHLAWTRRVRLRHLKLICDRFVFPPAQLPLFEAEQRTTARQTNIIAAMDRIRKRFGSQPSKWRDWLDLRDKGQRRNNVMKVEVKQLPGWQVAYIRVMDGYKSAEIKPAFRRVINWAQARELVGPDTVVLGVSLDNPDVTPADKCRYDACISVSPATKPEGEVGIYDIPAGKYAVYRTEGTYADINAELGQAWNTLMGDWFPDSGYQPDDRSCFEIYRETEEQALSGKYIVDICEPVKPL